MFFIWASKAAVTAFVPEAAKEDLMKTILIYLAAVNIAALAVMGADKYRAQRNRWRIREASILP